ncbi:MAG TPA: hypothetical protein VIO38_10745 [Rariglobus sp.]
MTPPALPGQRDQRSVDAGHLDLLAIFHFVLTGLSLLGLGFLSLHWLMMHTVLENPAIWENAKTPPPPKEFLAMFKWFYLFMGLVTGVMGAGNLISGFCIRRRRGRTFTLVVGGLDCLMIPFGTALGIFTIIVLSRDSVRETYEAAANPRR